MFLGRPQEKVCKALIAAKEKPPESRKSGNWGLPEPHTASISWAPYYGFSLQVLQKRAYLKLR